MKGPNRRAHNYKGTLMKGSGGTNKNENRMVLMMIMEQLVGDVTSSNYNVWLIGKRII